MKKLGLLLCVTSGLVLTACGTLASQLKDLPERDARVIVEVNKNISKLSEEGAKKTQLAVYNNIKAQATPNIKMIGSYTVLNNAFVIEVNSSDIESIKSVPGVKSVTVDKLHWEREINNDSYIVLNGDNGNDAIDESKNISAETMHLPEDNNEGEGTIVAILDNEFHFRAKLNSTTPEWHHEVFDPLADDVAVRYTFESIKKVTGLNAKSRNRLKKAGEEGSEYLNNKVPFYFDYGGTSTIYGKRGPTQFDVHSDLSYHGSHVSSITAANAPTYKGIAPKAQLALMKVFTDYNAKGIGEKIGLSNRTGAYDTSILEALEDCIRLKVDGINMSLGSDLDDFDGDSITLKTLTRLAKGDPENGIPAILTSISAGNSGKTSYASTGAYANWMPESVETGIMSSYANNAASMTIASGHPTKIFYENAFSYGNKNIAFEDQIVNRPGMDDDYDKEFRIKDIFPKDEEGHPNGTIDWIYVPGFGTSADYKGLDVEGKIAVVNRGSTAFADKYAVAVEKGAIALVIINNDPTASYFNFRCSFGDGFNPTMPCALVLFKDKAFFADTEKGSFGLISKQVSDNPSKYTVSDFSTDGATFDLDLKPEITAPGDNIRGAVPEHAMTTLTTAEQQSEEYLHKCYQYLSGTSMSAPNYAGAQAVVLSEVTAPIYQEAAGAALTDEQLKTINDYRDTVNMRLMSTADPIKDRTPNPESAEETISVTSPRIQGAGMVDLDGALNTSVYLEGLDLNGQPIGKSKIALRNNADIAKGDVKLTFLAHNESQETKTYDVTLTVMRPAIAHPNDVVTKDYNFKGTVENIEYFNGMRYYDKDLDRMMTASGKAAYKDVFKVGKDIEYYASEEDYDADQADIEAGVKASRTTIIAKGYYYNSATSGVCWEPLPSYTAQSTMDVEIAKITGQTVTVQPGENTININTYSLTEEQKKEILDVYEYGCMIEGFVTLKDKAENGIDLSIPYLGFFSGDGKYEDAPVVEPFNFEKDPTKVYPSDLANDIAKSLVAKNKANMESMIVAGYAESPQKVNIDQILENNLAFDDLTGFYRVGTDPLDDEYTANPSNDIYVGSENTNTMIIQQFVLRSVADNYFTITNKATGKTIYTSALEDMLFGDTAGKWALYKSHVDSGYLSAGYISHRAYAIVPLFDEATGEKFASGEYELKFNYQLAYNNTWVSKSYTLHIDSDSPEVTSISQYKLVGVDRVRIYLQDTKLSYGIVGYNLVDLNFDEEKNLYYIDETKEFIDECIEEISEGLESKRLYIGAIDYARGKVGCLVHFNDYDNFMGGYTVAQGAGLNVNYDFTLGDNNSISFVNTITGASVSVKSAVKVTKFAAVDPADIPIIVTPEVVINNATAQTNNVLGNNAALFITLGIVICSMTVIGVSVLFFRKRKGGKQYMKKKHVISLLAIGVMSFGALIGCNNEQPNPPQPISDPTTTSNPVDESSVNVESSNPVGDSSEAGHSEQSSAPVTPSSSAGTTSAPASSSSNKPASSSQAQSSSQTAQFSFNVALASGSKSINKGNKDAIEIVESNNNGTTRNYSFTSSDTSVATVDSTGIVTAVAKGSVRFTVRESTSRLQRFLDVTITDAVLASGGYNYASLAGEEAINTRTEILGQLEKYAIDNHLTGITLFENGGFVKYHERVTLPTTNYITGYGFGLLSEGSIDKDLDTEENVNYKRYLHSAISSKPAHINARNDKGSQISDLEGYITASYWGTKMNTTKDQYVWYPVLAKDTIKVNGVSQAFNRPVPVFNGEEVLPGQPEKNPLGLYKTWRIYVKTGAEDGIKYRYNGNSWGTEFDNTNVTIDDYSFAYRFLLTASHNFSRGTEMAADQTYGIKGAKLFNDRTKEISDDKAKELWDTMVADGSLGVKTGRDNTNGYYIELTILNAIDRFTAMYTLSSNLTSPMSENFVKTIGDGSVKEGAVRYGMYNNNNSVPAAHRDRIVDFVISVGPYMLEEWYKGQTIVFKRNTGWNEPGRYNIAGVKLIYVDASSDIDAIYKQFNAGNLDSCGIPSKHIKEEMGQPRVYKTRGDSTFKLNVNSCTQEYWNYLNDTLWSKDERPSNWDVKPWMSNDNFLNGLYYSIDRKTFAENRGVNPSINYFADSYLNDPENGKVYNDSDAHKAAVHAYETKDSQGNSTFGYSKDKAILAFSNAVKELVKDGSLVKGTRAKPKEIHIVIKWMNPTDYKEYGEEIEGYFTSAFNDDRVCNGTVKLVVDSPEPSSDWQQVYTDMKRGEFDLGFGAISGNTYNPLNFLEVLKSDNSSTFTLNWGNDTSKVNTKKPLIYDDKIWSFDSLWAVADHGGVVDNGENIKSVKKSYMTYTTNNFNDDTTFYVSTKFFEEAVDEDKKTVKFEVTRISIYIIGNSNIDLDFVADAQYGYKIVLTPEKAHEIRDKIIEAFKLMDPKKPESQWVTDPFQVNNYNIYWNIEVYYNLSIKDPKSGEWGTPSENYVTSAKNESSWKD